MSGSPPPDLVVEIDVTTTERARIDKRKLYADLRIPEVWRYRPGDGLEGPALGDDGYVRIESSRAIAGLPIKELGLRMERIETPLLAVTTEWRRWLEEHIDLHAGV